MLWWVCADSQVSLIIDDAISTYKSLVGTCSYILRPSSNWSPYIFMLVQKVKKKNIKYMFFINTARLCRDSASYFT